MARLPATAARLRGVAGSAVRDILALTERPGVISFAGGLPEPGLFDTAGLRAAFAVALGDETGRRSLQYSTTEGDPLLRERVAVVSIANVVMRLSGGWRRRCRRGVHGTPPAAACSSGLGFPMGGMPRRF